MPDYRIVADGLHIPEELLCLDMTERSSIRPLGAPTAPGRPLTIDGISDGEELPPIRFSEDGICRIGVG